MSRQKLERQGLQGPFCFSAWLCPGWAAVPDNSGFCFLLLLPPQLLRGNILQRAVVGPGLKADRGGSLHGSSTQAGRKWPCAKAGSGCCQTGRGGWAMGGGRVKPGGKVGGKKVGLGRSKLSPRNSELDGRWKQVCVKEEGHFCDKSGWCVSTSGCGARAWTHHCGPRLWGLIPLGLGMLCLVGDTLAVGKDALQTTCP